MIFPPPLGSVLFACAERAWARMLNCWAGVARQRRRWQQRQQTSNCFADHVQYGEVEEDELFDPFDVQSDIFARSSMQRWPTQRLPARVLTRGTASRSTAERARLDATTDRGSESAHRSAGGSLTV